MKCSLYIEDGIQQVIITPESDFEKTILRNIESKQIEVSIKSGKFSECKGGYVRMFDQFNENNDSLMLVLTEKQGDG